MGCSGLRIFGSGAFGAKNRDHPGPPGGDVDKQGIPSGQDFLTANPLWFAWCLLTQDLGKIEKGRYLKDERELEADIWSSCSTYEYSLS